MNTASGSPVLLKLEEYAFYSASPRHDGGSKSMIFEQAVRAEQLGLVSKTRIWDRTQVLARGL
jgi:hypothetical protein